LPYIVLVRCTQKLGGAMRRNLQRSAMLAAGAALLPAGAAGGYAADSGSEYTLGLTARQPGAPTGIDLRVLYRNPNDPDGKPPPLEEVRLELPAGLRFDTAAVARCEASDDELRTLGRGACPQDSRVGRGSLTAETGFPGMAPVETDLTIFNGGDELIELVSFKGTDTTAGSDRLKIDGSTLTAHPPATQGGPPDGRTTVREIKFTIDERGSFVTTPPDCPASGKWSSRGTFTFVSYPTPVTALSETPCVVRGQPARRGRMSLSVSPRVADAGERVRFRLRVRSGRSSCRRRVRVRLAGRRARTGPAGVATITARFHRTGRRAAYAAKRGCRPARTRVLVR
jgi:hypothetical protein